MCSREYTCLCINFDIYHHYCLLTLEFDGSFVTSTGVEPAAATKPILENISILGTVCNCVYHMSTPVKLSVYNLYISVRVCVCVCVRACVHACVYPEECDKLGCYWSYT